MENLAMIRQAFGEDSMSHTRVFERKHPNSPTGDKQSQSMLIIFFVIKGLFTNYSSWQTRESIPQATATSFWRLRETLREFARYLATQELVAA
jgi:hypothetical protein